ncbi:MAG TPA: hypothetical protein PLB41_19980, partial [Rubrivivax sp.]|nr:hypothetical protein [Rubrivivax sp.]
TLIAADLSSGVHPFGDSRREVVPAPLQSSSSSGPVVVPSLQTVRGDLSQQSAIQHFAVPSSPVDGQRQGCERRATASM